MSFHKEFEHHQSVAFPIKDLDDKRITKTIKGEFVSAERNGNAIDVIVENQPVPGYYEMWFS